MGLTPGELRTLAALAETLIPGSQPERVAGIAAEALGRAADPAQVLQLRLVLRALDHPVGMAATRGPARRFRSLPRQHREAVLRRWSTSAIPQKRAAFHAFRKLLAFIAYADPGLPEAPNPLPASTGYAPERAPVTAAFTSVRPLDVARSPSAGEGPLQLEADVVVVGSGAGGGVVAAELARAGRSVVVLEAGPFVDEGSMPSGELDAYSRLYLNHGLLSTWDGAVTILAGSGVGGGTLVNWMSCFDIPPAIRDEWARDHGLDGVDGAEWAADVAALEEELHVGPSVLVPPKDALILRGAAALGWEADRIRRNAAACTACGSCPFGCPAGAKESGIRVHLRDAHAHGARIVDRVRVTGLRFDGGRVSGVEARLLVTDPFTGMPIAPSADRQRAEVRPLVVRAPQVVLAAGALRSPAILEASGVAHPAVGRHLRLHPVPLVAAILRGPVDMWRGTMQAARSAEFGADEDGHRGYVIESAPGHAGLVALALPWEGSADHAALLGRLRHIAPLVAVTRDGGEGRVRLTRSGRVRIDYRLDRAGEATLRHALASMARLAHAAGDDVEEILGVGSPMIRHRRGEPLEPFLERLRSMDLRPNRGSVFSAHQMGTIRAGASPADHPADPRGRVRRDASGRLLPGVYVADGSTFPTGIGRNPMIGIMAMARRVSRTVLAEGTR